MMCSMMAIMRFFADLILLVSTKIAGLESGFDVVHRFFIEDIADVICDFSAQIAESYDLVIAVGRRQVADCYAIST